jgi:hypothetical protein
MLRGDFFGQNAAAPAQWRRIISGDYDIMRDEQGNTTGSATAKFALEYTPSDQTMFGGFLGADLGKTDITGSLAGNQTSYGAMIGGYFVTKFGPALYLDGNVALARSRNDTSLSDDTIALQSTYDSTTLFGSVNITGVKHLSDRTELWPSLAIDAGKTQLGALGFSGSAYGLRDDRLLLNAGTISFARLTMKPQLRMALGAGSLADAGFIATLSPKVMCEYVSLNAGSTQNCGSGVAIGVKSSGLYKGVSVNLGLEMDQLAGQTRKMARISADLSF